MPRLDPGRSVADPSVSAPSLDRQSEARFSGKFTLGAVNIDGATVFASASLAEDFDPLLASQVGETELNGIVDRITKRYRAAGYLLSYATLPEQSVQSGILRIRVVEGYVGEVKLEGAGPDQAALLRTAQPLLNDRPLRAATLERVLGLMRDLSGVLVADVRIARAPDDPARHILTIVVTHDRVRGLIYSDNRGTIDGARLRLYGSTSLSSLAVAGDQLQVDLFGIPGNGYRFVYGQVTETLPIGHDGLRLGVSASGSDQHQRLGGARLTGTSRNLTVQLSYPLLRSRALSAVVKGSFNDWRSEDKFGGAPFQRDRLRVGRLALDISSVGISRIDTQIWFSHGFDFDGATFVGDPLATRRDAGAVFTKANIDVQFARPISKRFTLRMSGSGQYSTHPLLSVEEFAIGGSRIGRAYDFNALTGDHGVSGALELGYRVGDVKGGPRQLELFGYVDGGAAFQSGRLSGLPKSDSLAGLGGGARFTLFRFNFSAELGIPLVESRIGNGVRGFASISKGF